MKTKQDKKIKLSRQEEQPLRLYFFICRPLKIEIKNEAILPIADYKLESALVQVRNLVKGSLNIVYTGQNMRVDEFVNKLYLEGKAIPPTKEPKSIKPLSKKRLTKQQFKSNLLMTLNEDKALDMKKRLTKKDKELLEKIIKKI